MKILMKKPLVGFKGDEKGNTSIVSKDYSSEKSSTEIFKPSSSSNLADMSTNSKVNELESTRAEMVEVKEENQRLKSLLAKIMDDYQKLQSQLTSSTQEGESKKSGVETSSTTKEEEEEEGEGEGEEDDDLVSLSLGTSSSGQRKLGEKNKGNRRSDHKIMKDNDDDVNMNTGLRLGFDCRLERSNSSAAEDQHRRISSQDNGYEDQKEEVSGHQPWQPSKILKVEDQRLCADEHIHIKKARVSVRARCDGPTMSDGCQWRKYGQKISKGNPCPRAYYRCTVAPSCPVRKQVQRCADDMTVLITTYEGTHDHPLPMAATAMASTTSAAANMIISGSSSSSATHPSITTPTSIMAPISPLNFRSYPNPIQSNLSTITLDLTSPSPNPSPPKPNIFSSSQPRFLFSNSSLDPISPPPPSPWGVNGYLGFGSNQSYNNNRIPNFSQQQSSLFLQKQSGVDQIQRSTTSGGNLTDNIAKAITTDPSFQSALATAINSFVSNRKDGGGNDHQSLGQNLKWGSSVNNLSSGGGFLDKIGGGGGGGGSDSNLQKGGSMIFHQNGFSGGKMISSALPVEKKEQRS